MHYNEVNSYLFVNGTEIHEFKAKDSYVLAGPLFPGKIFKKSSVDNIKKKWSNGYVYDLNVYYNAVAVDNILDIYKYLLKRDNKI